MSKESIGKRITDELREFIDDGYPAWKLLRKTVHVIADRIDAAHEEAIASVMNDALYHANDKDMADLGWYRALDADKQPIKFGDEVEWRRDCGDHELRHGIVTGIKTDDVGGELVHEILVNVDGFTVRIMPTILHHYKQPTVEDVLREFFSRYVTTKPKEEDDAIIAEYAAKLRLAGDAE